MRWVLLYSETRDYHPMNGMPPPTLKELEELVAIMRSLNLGSEPSPTNEAKRTSGRLSHRLTPDMMSEIISRYQAGEPTTTLSKDYGVSRSSIASLLRKEGVALRGQAMTKESIDRAVALYSQGLTIRQVADEVKYSYSTVRSAIRSKGVCMRASGVKQGQPRTH